jgi:hypothetical protein
MKKFLSGFICCFILMASVSFAANYTAIQAGFKIFVNGAEFKPSNPAVVIDGRTYLPLRAIGDALGVKVNWNDAKKQVEVGEPPKITPTPVKDVQPTPNIVLGKNEFLSRYNAVAPYDFKITVLGKVGEDLTKSVPYEVWQFKFENVRNQDMTFQISSLGWNQGTTITTVGTLGYPPISRRTLKPGESFTGCAALGITDKENDVWFFYGAGKILYKE